MRNRLAILCAAALSFALAGCGGESVEAPSSSAEPEAARHLRLAREQMRRHLFESAAAELDRVETLDADDPELWFQRARLSWATEGAAGPQAAIALLDRVVVASPDSVQAHRLLYELHGRLGDHERAVHHRTEVERVLGDLGKLEMGLLARYLSGMGLKLELSAAELAGAAAEVTELVQAFSWFERVGNYAPSEAVPVIEGILARHPELSVLRFHYAKTLIEQEIRVNFSPRPDLPPMSSMQIADYAQSHFEKVFDQSLPLTPLSVDTLLELSDVALRMADYDDAIGLYDLLLPLTRDEFMMRSLAGQKGLALYKQGRHAEAIGMLQASLQGANPEIGLYLPHLWILHAAYDAAGVDPAQRNPRFRFRAGLAGPEIRTPLRFEDIAPRLKLDKLDGLGPSAWGDVDGDGDFDLYVSGADSYGALYRNDGASFRDISAEVGLLHAQSGFSSTFVDYDNDGRPDLYVGRDGWSGPARNSLFHHDDDGVFREVTDEAGVGHPGASFVHAWTDYDRDGDLDLYVANGITGSGDTNVLYRNEGNGRFSDATGEAGLAEPPGTKTIGLAVGDYDKDGWPDLFVSGYATVNRLYRNRGDGTFEERAEAAGVADANYLGAGYVCFFLDYDNDTLPDILRTSLAPWKDVLTAMSDRYDRLGPAELGRMLRAGPRLHRNNGDGSFTDVSIAAGFVHPIGTMGANVADLDNDGFTDIYFGTGDPQIGRLEPDRFYRNNRDGTFTDLTFAVGLGNLGKGHGVTFIDLDGDGDLEIYAPEGGFWHGDPYPNALYLNRQATGNHWLHVDLRGRESNRDAVGARLTVEAGDLRVYREVYGGRGFGSSDSPTVEFGLGRATRVDRLEVVWPGGTTQSFRDLAVDRRIFLEEGGGLVEHGSLPRRSE